MPQISSFSLVILTLSGSVSVRLVGSSAPLGQRDGLRSREVAVRVVCQPTNISSGITLSWSGGSHSVARPPIRASVLPFRTALDAYCREHRERLMLVPELRAANNVIPDGTVKDVDTGRPKSLTSTHPGWIICFDSPESSFMFGAAICKASISRRSWTSSTSRGSS